MEWECPVCKSLLCWESDYDSDEVGYDTEGIVSTYHCVKCGAQIEILIPFVNPYKTMDDDN